jgi:uncharacterized membrane protein YphA (DoxX/SURF4 family)
MYRVFEMLVACALVCAEMSPRSTRRWRKRSPDEARTDFAMLLGALFLLLVGAGPWSIDGRIERRHSAP